MLRFLFYCGCLFLCGACGENTSQGPEEVLATYIHHLQAGDFAGATQLCTPAGAAYVEALQAIMLAPETLPDTSSVEIKSIRCQVVIADTLLLCEALIDDGFETYAENYLLRQGTLGWLIDHQPEDGETSSSVETISTEENTVPEN